MTLRADLDKLAASIAKGAAQTSTSLQEMVDALKALTPYYALTVKVDAKGQGEDEGDGDGATFEAFSAGIESAHQEERPNGRKTVRSRQQ